MPKQDPQKIKKEVEEIEEQAKDLENEAMMDIEMLYKHLFGLRHLRKRKEKLLKRLKEKRDSDNDSS